MTTVERSAERSADPDLAELETVTAQLAAAALAGEIADALQAAGWIPQPEDQ